MHASASYLREEPDGVPSASVWRLLRRHRFALKNLVLKTFRIQYRNMALGVFWSVLNPLIMLGVLVIVFSYLHPGHHADFFPIFLLIGLVMYGFLSLVLPTATTSVLDNSVLVKRVIFPRELIPLSAVLSQMIHMGIQLLLLLIFLVLFSVPARVSWLWALPVLGVLFTFILGLSLACAALHVLYRDMLYIVESLLKVAFWLTPVFYDLSQVERNLPRPLYLLYISNPLAGCIDGLRNALLRGQAPAAESMALAAAVSLLVLVGGWRLFQRLQRFFPDHL